MYTYTPQARTTPDQGGTQAVSSDANDGHGSTVTSSSAFDSGPIGPQSDSDAKSCRWHTVPSFPGANRITVRLKFSWTASGSVGVVQDTAGSGSASIQFKVEYSVDGGLNWITQVNQSKSVSGANVSDSLNASGSEDVLLSSGQDMTLIQVRDRMDTSASATAPTSGQVQSDASITTTVSGIQVEVVAAQSPVVMM